MRVEQERKPILWLIDENKLELRTHFLILQQILPSSIEIRPIEAYPHLTDYLSILEESLTACIITDQRLKDRGTANYFGIELAEYLRSINPKVPIYILTNYADDRDEFLGGEWSVEDIIKKKDLEETDGQNTIASRITRRINIYEDILDERSERLQELLSRSMNGELAEADLQEIEKLELQNASPTLTRELGQIKQLRQIAKEHQELMSQINQDSSEGF